MAQNQSSVPLPSEERAPVGAVGIESDSAKSFLPFGGGAAVSAASLPSCDLRQHCRGILTWRPDAAGGPRVLLSAVEPWEDRQDPKSA